VQRLVFDLNDFDKTEADFERVRAAADDGRLTARRRQSG
jgi:hypothetical protein